MLNIFKIPVPTPYDIGPVNSYLIKNEPFTLVDPGPNTETAKNALTQGLKKLGVELSQIKRAALTHSHVDHCGLVPWLQRTAGVEAYMHQLEMRKIGPEYDFYLERQAFLQEAGLPSAVLQEILNDFDPIGEREPLGANTISLNDGDALNFDGGALTALHIPGHAEGLICLYDQEGGSFLCGDFVLKRITPNPNMEPDSADFSRRLPTLSQYLSGLSRLEALNPKLILPGHGENINDGKSLARAIKEHHLERLQEIYELLKQQQRTVFQLMRLFYPDIKGFEIYLGVSEVYAHVDYLVAEGRAVKQNLGPSSVYRSV